MICVKFFVYNIRALFHTCLFTRLNLWNWAALLTKGCSKQVIPAVTILKHFLTEEDEAHWDKTIEPTLQAAKNQFSTLGKVSPC